MDKIILPDRHLTFTSKSAVKEICTPLLKNTPIGHIYYVRLYPDNSFIRLGTSLGFYRHCLANAGKILKKQSSYFQRKLRGHEEDLILFEKEPMAANIAKECFGINNLVCMVKHRKGYIEEFGFANHKTASSMDFYFNHLDILLQFDFYFKEKAKDLIFKSEQEYRVQAPVNIGFQPIEHYSQRASNSRLNKLKQKIALGRYYLSDQQYLSHQEFLCLQQLARGKGMKDTGECLKISAATVKEYIDRAKERGHFSSNDQLLEAFFKSDLYRIAHIAPG